LGAEVRVKGLKLQREIFDFLQERGYLVFYEVKRCDLAFFSKNLEILYVVEVKNYRIPKNKMRKIVYRLNQKKKQVAEHFRKLGFKFKQVVPILIARVFERRSRKVLCYALEEFMNLLNKIG